MYIEGGGIGCCAVNSIRDLRFHTGPEDALASFCIFELGKPNKFKKTYRKLSAFYIFSAGPQVPQTHPEGSTYSSTTWVKYGKEFSLYLRSHGLGQVATTAEQYNFRSHPKNKAQVWIWRPDHEALTAWWEAYQEAHPDEVAAIYTKHTRRGY